VYIIYVTTTNFSIASCTRTMSFFNSLFLTKKNVAI